MTKLGSLISHFLKTYRLPPGDLSDHDGIHAMTGFGIHIADELRVAVLEIGVYGGDTIDMYHNAHARERDLYFGLISRARSNVEQPPLSSIPAKQAESATMRLAAKEVDDLFSLGIKMRDAIYHLTGKHYGALSEEQISTLDFTGLDFVAEAQAIKARHDLPENKAVEERVTRCFWKAAGRRDDAYKAIPRAGQPWHAVMRLA